MWTRSGLFLLTVNWISLVCGKTRHLNTRGRHFELIDLTLQNQNHFHLSDLMNELIIITLLPPDEVNLLYPVDVEKRGTHHDERAEQHGLDPLGTLMPEWSNGTSDILSEPTRHDISLCFCVQNFYSTNISDIISRTGSSACRTAAGHLCIAIIVYSLYMKFLPCWTEQTRLQGENRLPDGGWTDRHTVKCSVIWSFFRVTDIKAQSVLHGLYSIFSSSSSHRKWKNVRLSLQTILLF